MLFKIREVLAFCFRQLPSFRGKARLGTFLGNTLTNYNNNSHNIANIKMKDGCFLKLDIRSRTEKWAYYTGQYDSDLIKKFSSCLRAGDTVLDIGANVGFYSVPLGKRLDDLGGILHAFEPVNSNFKRLCDVIEINRLKNTVFPHKIALGDKEGSIEMWIELTNNSVTGNAGIIKGKTISKNTENVKITKLDNFSKDIKIKNCRFIKVDIEGAEIFFLEGAREFIKQHRPIIYGEFNTHFLRQCHKSFLNVAEILQPLNYRFFKQKNRKGDFVEVEKLDKELENVLLVPSNTPTYILSTLGISK